MPDSAFGAGADIKQGVNKILESVGAKPAATTSTGDALRAEAGKNMVEKMRILALSTTRILRRWRAL